MLEFGRNSRLDIYLNKIMNSFQLNKFKFIIHILSLKLLNYFRVYKGDWVMGRVACLGQDVYKLLNLNLPIINYQKARIDYLNDVFSKTIRNTQAIQAIPYIPRDDIKGLVLQQEALRIYNESPKALYMDSYSELTDQRFLSRKQKWSFYANYSDIAHSEEFKNKFESQGLLGINDILDQYRQFFSLFRLNYGSVPIIFIHFPIKLETREKFKLRAAEIKNAIDLLKNDFQPFYSFEVNDEIVDWPKTNLTEIDFFPYHYNQDTYTYLANQIKSINVFKSS
jgi:hypothetical protein